MWKKERGKKSAWNFDELGSLFKIEDKLLAAIIFSYQGNWDEWTKYWFNQFPRGSNPMEDGINFLLNHKSTLLVETLDNIFNEITNQLPIRLFSEGKSDIYEYDLKSQMRKPEKGLVVEELSLNQKFKLNQMSEKWLETTHEKDVIDINALSKLLEVRSQDIKDLFFLLQILPKGNDIYLVKEVNCFFQVLKEKLNPKPGPTINFSPTLRELIQSLDKKGYWTEKELKMFLALDSIDFISDLKRSEQGYAANEIREKFQKLSDVEINTLEDKRNQKKSLRWKVLEKLKL